VEHAHGRINPEPFSKTIKKGAEIPVGSDRGSAGLKKMTAGRQNLEIKKAGTELLALYRPRQLHQSADVLIDDVLVKLLAAAGLGRLTDGHGVIGQILE
jgi:hypothetical protein